MKIKRFILLLIILPFQYYAQNFEAQILSDIYLDSSLIGKQGIRSAHVYSEIIEDNYDRSGNYLITLKRMEMEFNPIGMLTYRRSLNLTGHAFALGDKETMHESYAYNEDLQLITHCSKQEWQSYCEHFTYDDQGHITAIRNDGKSIQNGLITFEWKNDKMVNAVNTDVEEETYFTKRKFDTKGRIKELVYPSGRLTYEYIETDNEFTTVSMRFRDDSLVSRIQVTTLKESEKIAYVLSQNGKLDTLNEIRVNYDEHHNLIYLRNADYSDRYHVSYDQPPPIEGIRTENQQKMQPEKSLPPIQVNIYNIRNNYENGLLAKRNIYATSENRDKGEKLMFTERIIYDKEPLMLKSWPNEEED